MVWKNTKIYVGNLPESCQASDLQEAFEKYGKVEECDMVKNYGFVHMSSEEEAKAAIEGLNNSEFMGAKITVEASHSKVRQRPGMGGRGQCYRCGRQGHWSKECPRNPTTRMQSTLPPLPPMSGYLDRPLARFGPDRTFSFDRSFPDRSYDRMRPYPDLYDRRPPPSPGTRDDFYYRQPYDDGFSYTRRSPPPPPLPPVPSTGRLPGSYEGFDFSDDRSYATGRLTPPAARRAPVF